MRFISSPVVRLALVSVLATAIGTASASDVEDGFLDLRLGYSLVDKSYEGTVDNGVTTNDFEDDWDESHRVFAQLIGSPGLRPVGLLLGISLGSSFRDTDSDDSDADIEYDAWAAHGHVGVGFAFGEIFQLELVPFVGVGSARLKRVTPGGIETSDNSTLIEFGGNVNGVFTFQHFQVGAQIGYLMEDSRLELEQAGDDREYDFDEGIFLGSLFLGYRF